MLKFYISYHFSPIKLFLSGKGGNEFADEIACALRTAYSNDYVVPDFEKYDFSSKFQIRNLFLD